MENNRKGLYIFLAILGVSLILAFNSASNRQPARYSNYSQASHFTSNNNIAVINVVGTISVNDGSSYDQQWLLDTIDEVSADSDNQAILLYVDSSGGSVYETDEVYLSLLDYKAQTGRPVYVSMGQMAASGGYYIAMAGDKLYANRNTLTGSIGIIMGSYVDLTGLMDKLGIKMTTFTAGANKNMLGPDAPVTAEQRAIMQSIIDEAYDQFVGVVATGRSMDEAVVRPLADGRIYSAQQAAAHGLIDGVATFEETQDMMVEDLGLKDPIFYYFSYKPEKGFLDLIGLNAQGGLKGLFNQSNEIDQLKEALSPLSGRPAYYYHY